MKIKILIALIAILIVAGVLLGLKRDKPSLGSNTPIVDSDVPADTTAQAPAPLEAGSYIVTEGQTIGWNAKKRVGGGHNGTIDITSGSFETDGNNVSKAEIVFSLESLTSLDLEPGKGKEKLESDLKGKDFFYVEKYQTGSFTLTSPSPIVSGTATLVGDLKLKDKSQKVSIPVVVQSDNGVVMVTGTFSFNRTKFDINYASASIPGAVKDVIIEDEVGVTIASTFKKQ